MTDRAPATAVRLLERAREITEDGAGQRVLGAELIEPLRLTGRLRDAERLARTLLDGGPESAFDVLVHTGLAGVTRVAAGGP